jgi:hypothetical protein
LKASVRLAVLFLLFAAPAHAESLGVTIVAPLERDAGLADNLSEVAMARVAQIPGRTLVGNLELRARLGAEGGTDLAACLEQAACLARVGAALGISRILTGVVRSERGRYFLNLTLTDIAADRSQGHLFREVDGPVADLVRVLVEGVDQLLDPARAPAHLQVRSAFEAARVSVDNVYLGSTPLVSGALEPGRHALRVELERHFPWRSTVLLEPGRALRLDLGPNELPARRAWPTYMAYGGGTGAVLAMTSGLVLGALARIGPSGQTREEAQMDLERRRSYGRISTSLLVGGAVVGALSALAFARYWRDITGD